MMKKISQLLFVISLLCSAIISNALTFNAPRYPNSVIGDVSITQVGFRNVINLMQQYDVGFYELVEANPGVQLNRLPYNQKLLIPTRFLLPQAPRKGIVVNLAEMRVYYYGKNHEVMTYPVGIGKPGWRTPLLKTEILDKEVNPAWIPTQETREDFIKQNGYPLPDIVPSGPENPLGYYAMRFTKWNFLMHGTSEPEGVGQRVSGGCLRLQNEDIEKLFKVVRIDTPVRIIYEPYKAGWKGNTLYLEVHEPIQGYPKRSYRQAIRAALKERPHTKVTVDWADVNQAVELQMGVPMPIGHILRFPSRGNEMAGGSNSMNNKGVTNENQ